MSLCIGQIAIIHFQNLNFPDATKHFEECLVLANDLNAQRMKLECYLCLAYMHFTQEKWPEAKE